MNYEVRSSIYLTLTAKMSILSFALLKIPLIAIAFIIISTLVVVLWQRQPKAPGETQEIKNSTETQGKDQKQQENFTISPNDNTVVKSQNIKLSGKTLPDSLLIVYSNSSQNVIKTNKDGDFEKEITLSGSLNLFKIIVAAKNLDTSLEKNLSLYFSKDDVGSSIVAGPVKSIFENLITITSANAQKNVRTSKSTNFDFPQEKGVEEATKAASSVRIGDFAIAAGDSTDKDSISAKSLQIIRDNKPQVTKQLVMGTISSDPKQNIFPLKSKKDGQIVEFKLAKNSKVQMDDKDAKTADIKKDKMAIIFYTKGTDTNTPDLIYLLP